MLKTYALLALRSLQKSPLFTALNIFGLAFGLAVSMILFLHVRQEVSFDQYHRQVNQIYRVIINSYWDPANPEMLANAPNVIAPTMQAEIPAVTQAARVLHHEFGASAFVTAGTNKLVEDKLFWVDPSFPAIFDVPVLTGNLAMALSEPNAVALSRSTAMRYFGTSNAVGQTMRIDQLAPMTVQAVFEDFPGNSSFEANILGAFKTIKWANAPLVWSNSSFETWVLLAPDASRKQVEQQMVAMHNKHEAPPEQRFSMWLQPLRDVHLYSGQMDDAYTTRLGSPSQVGILGALAMAVLLIACFNYMNLSTARSQLRFREVGINKTMGATRGQLAFRFYVETGVLTLFALILSIGMLVLGIPLFNQLADKHLTINALREPQMWLVMMAIGMGVALLAGSYPAVFLSSFLPKNLLQTSFNPQTKAGWLRRGLVTTQFTASVVLILATGVLYRQMQYVQQKSLGFEPQQVVAITTVAAESREQLTSLIEKCRAISSVQSVCRAQTFPGKGASGRSLMRPGDTGDGMDLSTNHTTPDIEKVLGIKLLAGATLPAKQPDDTLVHVILNKKAIDYLGYTPEGAIGKKVDCDLGDNAYICGVVEDFHAQSLHQPIGAYAFHNAMTETRRFLLVKMNSGNLPETMQQLEKAFNESLPHSAFEYTFLDSHLQNLYKAEQQSARIMGVFSLLSVLICCLGLFGLAAFAAEQRTKEIGVRKVLGASVLSIARLLNRDFVRMMLLATVLGAPIAYYFLNGWLANFTYHIQLEWWMFVAAGAVATVIAAATVSLQSIKAALANPVKSLRNE